MKHYILHLAAKNNINGNPRRLYVVFDETGKQIDIVDEGYCGIGEVAKKYPRAIILGSYETTPAQRRELLKTGGK